MLDNLKKYDVVLASNSPRRKELLEQLGVNYRVELIKGIDETHPADMPAHEIAEYLSRIEAVIVKRREQLDRLESFRRSVIQEYTTGKKEVRQ